MLRYFFAIIRKLLLAALAIGLAISLGVQLWVAAWVWHYRDNPPVYTPFMHLGTGSPGAPKLQFQWVDRQDIAPALEQAVLAAEDARFMEHKGLDWEGIRHAYQKNKSAGSTVAGGSTLTQQLAKNLFLSRKKTYWRKAQEAFIALMMEQMLTKERILTLYLNVAQWGHGIYGAEAAAQYFFQQSAKQLTPGQAAELALRLPSPTYYHDQGISPSMREQQQRILQQMPLIQLPTRVEEAL